MPRICPKCGTKLPAGSDICPFCGKPADDDVQIYTPHTEKKPPDGKKSRRIAAGALAAVLVTGCAAGLLRASQEHTPQKTAEAFCGALAAGDYESLCAVAEPAGELTFTEDALAPMFTLYRESAAFRQQAQHLAEAGNGALRVEKRRSFPFATYRVLVDACKLDVVTNVANASVTVGTASETSAPLDAPDSSDTAGYSTDAPNLVRAEAGFDALFPGLYDVDVSYTSEFGQEFEKSTTVSLMQPAQTELNLDYTSLYVWNSSSMSVDLSVDGAYYTSLPAGASIQLAPLQSDTLVTASCQTEAGETLTDSVTAASRSFEVLFSLGSVDVYNDYDADMHVQLNGADYGTIPAKTLQTISGVSLGSTLCFTLEDSEIFSPYEYQLVYDYDSICPILTLSDETKLAVCAVLQDALSSSPLEEDSGLLGGLDQLLFENGWSRSEVVISDVTIEDVYAMQPEASGTLLRLSGSYACTNITLPDSFAVEPAPDETGDAAESDTPEPIRNPQYQGFYASVFYDGENWFIAE